MNYIQQAYKGKNDWWRYILVILFTFIGWQILGMIPFILTAIVQSPNYNAFNSVFSKLLQGKEINANLYLFYMIFSFALGLFFLLKGVKWFHKRTSTSLITSRKKIDWKRVLFGFGLWLSIAVAMISVEYFSNPEAFLWNFKLVPFIILVLISFLFLPLQTSFEEVLFRGYFMQGLGILSRNRWIPLLITSVAFGLLHGVNPEVDKLGYMIFIYYIGTGFFFGITTLMDEGLELALGMHAANNIAAAVLVTTNWTVFQTDALFIDTSEPNLNAQAFIPVFVIYPLVLFLFSKKYGWSHWREKLFGNIENINSSPTKS